MRIGKKELLKDLLLYRTLHNMAKPKRFGKKDRQEIINDYLNKTGRNSYVPAEFVEWIQGQPKHPAYKLFVFEDDPKMALQQRIQIASQFATGCKITIKYKPVQSQSIDVDSGISIPEPKVLKFPTYISPIDNRAQGGGYQKFDLDNPDTVSELCRQACRELRAWVKRHKGICAIKEVDIENLEEVANSLEEHSVESEAI